MVREDVTKDYIEELVKRISGCVALSVPKDKLGSIQNLVERHANDILNPTRFVDEETTKKSFNNFVNKCLSVVETIGLSEGQYKAVRKLILAEIYGCRDVVIQESQDKNSLEN